MARILLVDDEEMDRTFGRAILEDAGHELFYASNGEVALRTYRNQGIDLVVTDLAMPGLNGLRLIQQLRELDGQALVIAVTGVSPEQLERAEALGAAVTLRKPYAPETLLKAVQQLLDSTIQRPPDDLWR
jgi:CheY-like chemotaxis protein